MNHGSKLKLPEDKSDELDQRILAVSSRGYKQEKIRTALLVAMLTFIGVGFICQVVLLQRLVLEHSHITEDTNKIVGAQIPGLEKQIKDRDKSIAEKDKTIEDQQYILVQQAVPAIQRLSQQVKELGGDPGQVILKAPED